MNDIEFSHSVSPQLGDLYEHAKNLRHSTPGYALTLLRSFAGAFCEIVDPSIDQVQKLERKIARLRDKSLFDHKVLALLRTLQKHGNVAAHPQAFSFITHDYLAMLDQALDAALGLLEHLHRLKQPHGEVPKYRVTTAGQDNLHLLSYRAFLRKTPTHGICWVFISKRRLMG